MYFLLKNMFGTVLTKDKATYYKPVILNSATKVHVKDRSFHSSVTKSISEIMDNKGLLGLTNIHNAVISGKLNTLIDYFEKNEEVKGLEKIIQKII